MAVIESKGNGYSLFNGVKLPSLPEWDKATYPYITIVTNSAGTAYRIRVTEHPFKFEQSSGKMYMPVASLAMNTGNVEPTATDWGTWTGNSGYTPGQSLSSGSNNPFWANYDMVNVEDDAVYLAASDPISLDGMNVIEWDGDTTGLEAFPGDAKYFCVSSTTDVDVNKNCVLAIKRISAGDVIITQTTLTDGGGYWKASNRINYINTISEDYPTTGCFFITRGTQFLSIFAYHPIAEPEQPEEPEGGDISAGIKHLIREIFDPVFAELMISHMRK